MAAITHYTIKIGVVAVLLFKLLLVSMIFWKRRRGNQRKGLASIWEDLEDI